jgi:hypothetical protein
VRIRKAKAQIPNPNFQTTKDGFMVFGIWSLELGISMFFPFCAQPLNLLSLAC